MGSDAEMETFFSCYLDEIPLISNVRILYIFLGVIDNFEENVLVGTDTSGF